MSGNNWLEILVEADFLTQIYRTSPDLSKISVHEVSFDREAAVMRLRFDLPDFPINPPETWTENCFNRVQITLNLTDLTFVNVEGWSYEITGPLSICKTNTGVLLSFSGNGVNMKCAGAFLIVEKINPYCDGGVNN